MACVSICLALSPRLTVAGFSSNKPLIRLRSPIDRYSFLGISTERFLSNHRKFNSHGIVVVKATSIDKVSHAIKPSGSVESDKLPTDVRKRAMEVVDECGRRVTVGDVASRAGLKVIEAQKALQALAADTYGFLGVSDDGDVLYVFPKDYRTKLSSKSLRIKIEPFLEKAKVLQTVYSCFLWHCAYSIYCRCLYDNYSPAFKQKRGRRRGYDSGFNFYINPVHLFWYWDPNYYRR